jgi:hypothetical protein
VFTKTEGNGRRASAEELKAIFMLKLIYSAIMQAALFLILSYCEKAGRSESGTTAYFPVETNGGASTDV